MDRGDFLGSLRGVALTRVADRIGRRPMLLHRRTLREGYDQIAEHYLSERVAGGDLALIPELVDRVAVGDDVLDAGCGAGVPVMPPLVDGGLSVIGLDLSLVQLRLARSHFGTDSVVQADLAALPFRDGSFSGLVSYYAVIHVPRSDHRNVFREFVRVLRQGGVALLCLGARVFRRTTTRRAGLARRCSGATSTGRPNLEMLRDEGFAIVRDEIVDDPMSHGRHLFVLATRQ